MNHTVTEESGEPLARRPYSTEGAMLTDLFGQGQQHAAGLLLFSRGNREPTTPETVEALRDVALIWQKECERFLQETA